MDSNSPSISVILDIVRAERDKFRRLLSEAEAEHLEGKLAYLDLENVYERERMMRMNLVNVSYHFISICAKAQWQKLEQGGRQLSGHSSGSSKSKATIDISVVQDDTVGRHTFKMRFMFLIPIGGGTFHKL